MKLKFPKYKKYSRKTPVCVKCGRLRSFKVKNRMQKELTRYQRHREEANHFPLLPEEDDEDPRNRKQSLA